MCRTMRAFTHICGAPLRPCERLRYVHLSCAYVLLTGAISHWQIGRFSCSVMPHASLGRLMFCSCRGYERASRKKDESRTTPARIES